MFLNKIISILYFCAFLISSCRKTQAQDCGCNSKEIKYSLQNLNGSLLYFNNKNEWAILYQPLPGNYSYYFPCNKNIDSLQAIISGALPTDIIQIKFSGKIKTACLNEDFGITNGVTTFDYIILDSIKRN
jgi:hypothetical protein